MKIEYTVMPATKNLVLIAENEAERYQLQIMSELIGCAQIFPSFLTFELK